MTKTTQRLQVASGRSVVAGELAERLAAAKCASPAGDGGCQPGAICTLKLRPYCLADDMGLGKTIQVICCCSARKPRRAGRPSPAAGLPASLLGNWRQELARFAPSLRALFCTVRDA
jgi:hypothetical protein